MLWTNATNSIVMFFTCRETWLDYVEKLRLNTFPCGSVDLRPPPTYHQSLFCPFKFLPIDSDQKGSQIWMPDTDISQQANIDTTPHPHIDRYKCVQIYRHKCGDWRRVEASLVQIFWQADWRLDAALTDLGIGRCATLCLARETGFVFFGNLICLDEKSDLSQHILAY